jgi:large repetitive protein
MQAITVDVIGDTLFESNETFFVNLSNGTHGRGTIVNDDAASANLSIAMTTEPSWFTPGQAVLFKIVVTNSGPGAATGVVVTDAIPPPMTFISATSPVFTCIGTMIVTCSAATLANGASATISLVAFANGTDPIVNTASVIANASAPAFATVQIAPPPRRRPMRH